MDATTRTSPPAVAGADVLALLSEELRGPLTSVVGYLDVLLDGEVGELAPGQARVAEVAARNAARMERLVDDLVVVAEVLSGGLSPRPLPVDVAALLEEAVVRAAPDAHAGRVRLSLALDVRATLTADAPALERMVDQMLATSIRACAAGGHVAARLAHAEGAHLVIEVADDGLPLAPGDAEALFAGSSEAVAPRALLGSRLGLLLVRIVAERHGGGAALEPTAGGAVLRVVLPARHAGGDPPA